MSFEEFTMKRRPVIDTPMVSILKQGLFGFNVASYDKYLKKHKYIIFLYDKVNNKIGIKPTSEVSGNAYNIRVSKDGRVANVSASSFLNHYGIPHTESKSYACTWNSKEELLEIDLGKE